jgi:membrane-associated PAP2 superfamily phosphatase
MNPDSTFWRWHFLVPALIFALLFAAFELLDLDRTLAHALYFDEGTQHWLGKGAGDWWARRLLHSGGRWVVRVVAAGALTVWALSHVTPRLVPWRRDARFVVIAILASIVTVGLLKSITNVDCPWDLADFGGSNPYIKLFADRPDWLPRTRCFPGAHSSSGFALLCFYFVLRDRSAAVARGALIGALLVGVAFSIGQEARGAHFLSHDLASGAIVWFIQLALYVVLMKPRSSADS